MTRAFWQDLRDTVMLGKGQVINFSYEAIYGAMCNVRMTRAQAFASREALTEALSKGPATDEEYKP